MRRLCGLFVLGAVLMPCAATAGTPKDSRRPPCGATTHHRPFDADDLRDAWRDAREDYEDWLEAQQERQEKAQKEFRKRQKEAVQEWEKWQRKYGRYGWTPPWGYHGPAPVEILTAPPLVLQPAPADPPVPGMHAPGSRRGL